ncbi:MAG: hypothetical protein M1812_007821 [Candelaria pacifica]|nr:MAG: hypothetical protein M1812_007821 [Candelaria pacifica]
MPNLRKIAATLAVGLVAFSTALPLHLSARQAAASSPLSDTDILQFALTLEHLESAFYAQGFAKFTDSDFAALGLSKSQIDALKMVGQTEATHVSVLLSAIAGAGIQPVQPCTYEFGFTDAKGMIATARILEAVGVSAYLGAAPLLNSSTILSKAASIATVEARHQTFIRAASGNSLPIPSAFDTPLGVRSVFTLAAPFIKSCPSDSNLNITPFPAIKLLNEGLVKEGTTLLLGDVKQPEGAAFCVFGAGGGGSFVKIEEGGCRVPVGVKGEVYLSVSRGEGGGDEDLLAG